MAESKSANPSPCSLPEGVEALLEKVSMRKAINMAGLKAKPDSKE